MIKEVLQEKEPIAYLSLKNDLQKGHLAHSYLLYGELNPLKTEAAFLLAQSIIESKNDFACETCDTCKRIRSGNYFDVIYLDGYKGLVKKDEIERIMEEFSRTSLEQANKKIYIINNINNASTKVLNMILKFMEEPSNEDTYGIFISDNIDGLLPTVVSRCEKIPFVTRDFSNVIKEYESVGFDDIDAYFLANIKHAFDSDMDLNDAKFLNAKEYVCKTLDMLDQKEYLPILIQKEFVPSVSKEDFKETSDYYLSIMLMMIEDALASRFTQDEEYNRYLRDLRKRDIEKLFDIFLNAKEKSALPINRQLLFDQIFSQIIL